jgi:hypothetical protein
MHSQCGQAAQPGSEAGAEQERQERATQLLKHAHYLHKSSAARLALPGQPLAYANGAAIKFDDLLVRWGSSLAWHFSCQPSCCWWRSLGTLARGRACEKQQAHLAQEVET